MSKKKAIKIATASAIAASAFAAVAPTQSEAATSVKTLVDDAVKAAKKAREAYTTSSTVVPASKLTPLVEAAEKKIKAAEAKVNGLKGGDTKDGYLAKLSTAKKYVSDVKAYIAAVEDAKELSEAASDLKAAVIEENISYIKKNAKDIAALKGAADEVKKQVVGATAEKAIINKYLKYAADIAQGANAVYYAEKANYYVGKNDVETAKERIEVAKAELEGVSETSAFGKAAREAVKKAEEAIAAKEYEAVKKAVEEKVAAFEALANGDLSTQEKIDAANAAKDAVKYDGLNDADKAAFEARVTEANKKVDAAIEAIKAPKVESVSAINSKSVTVKFNKTVDDTKAVFGVTKDSFKVNVAATTWNADKTEATLELTSKLTAGTYSVSVTGLTDSALTGSVVAQDEKVAGIEILSENAPLNDKEASVGYKVVNQYGEDLTKLEDVEVSLSGAKLVSATAGTLTFTSASGTDLKAGDKVVATIIHKASATSTTKTLTVSAAAKASEVSFGTLYNKDGKTLNEDTNLSTDKFYLPLEVKDQYGNVITDAKKIAKDDLFITNTNPLAVTADLANLTTIKIGDKDTLVLPLSVPAGKTTAVVGETTITVIAAASGKNTQSKVTVAETTRTDEVKFGTATVFAGEETLVPVTVKDKNGNEIKDLKVLKDEVKGIKVTSKVGVIADELVEKDGALYIKVAPLANKNDVHTVVVQSSTNKVATVTLTAKDAIAPKVITGLDSKVSTSVRELAEAKVEIDKEDIVVEDQYGQAIAADKLLAKLGDDYKIVAETVEGAPFTVSGEITKVGGVITVAYKAGQDRTSANVTFKLAKYDEIEKDFVKVEASSYAKEFSVVKDSSFASYKVNDIAPIYVTGDNEAGYAIPAGYGKAIVVKAVTGSGGEVTLDEGDDYTVKSTVLDSVADSDVTGNDAAAVNFDKDATTATAKVTITINATGEEIVKDVTFSNVAPKVEKVEVVKNETVVNGEGVAQAIAPTATLTPASASATYAKEAAFDIDEVEGLVDFVVTDTYGVRVALDEKADTVTLVSGTITPTLTFTKVSGDVSFSGNGTDTASVVAFSENSVFNVKLNAGSVSATPLKVTATEALTVTPK